MSTKDLAISIEDVVYRWSPRAPAVLDLPELKVQRGESVFIRGPSGSGKSTLLNLIAGVLAPQEGLVSVLGQNLHSLSAAARDAFRAEHIGVIFQLFNLIPYLSVLDNVLLPCRFSPRRGQIIGAKGSTPPEEARRLLERLDMAPELLKRPAAELSVGQQQRVAAARALMGSPQLLIADEPTSNLDAERRTAFLKLLLQECTEQQCTLVFVSHDASLESMFDRGLALDAINRCTS